MSVTFFYWALRSSGTMSNTSKIKLGNEILLVPGLCLGQMEVAAYQKLPAKTQGRAYVLTQDRARLLNVVGI